MHELVYETKAIGKEQYHNNFRCYGFAARSNASYPVPTFRKRWPEAWMEEWFYVKNDLIKREDIKGIIQCPIWSRFGLRRPKVEIDDAAEACQRAFSTVCSFVGTRDLMQEHIAFRVWPLVENWDMPKETTTETTEGGLVRLKYTFRFRDRFDELNDDWLKSIEAISDELLGIYSKAEDNALSTAFGGRGKKRLNRVFDAIGFMYPDYRYPPRGQEKKRKVVVSDIQIDPTPKSKKMKVLTHRPRYIEPAVVPDFGVGSSSAAEATQTVPIVQNTKEPTVMPKSHTIETIKDKVEKAKEPKVEVKMPRILSSPTGASLPKAQKSSAATPKRRRMANVLDAVVETTKALSPSPAKKIVQAEAKATESQAEAEVGPSVPIETEPLVFEEKSAEQIAPEKIGTEALTGNIDYIIRHASGKKLSEEEILEAKHYARSLKYPKGALVFHGSNEDDFLYCLPDNKEISICREIGTSMGFPRLEDGLSLLSKDELDDSLAYNSIKV
jgi:hypothetical protein